MKTKEFMLIDTCLQKADEALMECYTTCDTSEDEEWSIRFDNLITELRALKEEMIFTFEIKN